MLCLAACGSIKNPAAPNFNATASDAKAITIADECMQAMGGRANWDKARFFVWNFFGSRKLYWDKKMDRARVDYLKKDLQISLNLNDLTGKVKKDGELLTNPDSLSKYLQMGKEAWINDAYWLVMPFKLKDSGVTLKYIDERANSEGALVDVLQLTFDGVGVTPENKYWVYVDKESKLVTQWDFFTNFSDEEARFSTPWKGYKNYQDLILLCGDRGKYALTEIALYNDLPDVIFDNFKDMEHIKIELK